MEIIWCGYHMVVVTSQCGVDQKKGGQIPQFNWGKEARQKIVMAMMMMTIVMMTIVIITMIMMKMLMLTILIITMMMMPGMGLIIMAGWVCGCGVSQGD